MSVSEFMTILRKKDIGPVAMNKEIAISEAEFKINFTTLRHMELARASKQEDKICYTTFGE